MKLLPAIHETDCILCQNSRHLGWYISIDDKHIPFRNNKFAKEDPYDRYVSIDINKSLSENGYHNSECQIGCGCSINTLTHRFSVTSQTLPQNIPIIEIDLKIISINIAVGGYFFHIKPTKSEIDVYSIETYKPIMTMEYDGGPINKNRIDKYLILI